MLQSNYAIRHYEEEDIKAIIELSILAWEPVFQSFERILGSQIYPFLYPEWRKSQAEGVEATCRDQDKFTTLVAVRNEQVVGFLTYELHGAEDTGYVVLLAVHPNHQNDGIGTALNNAALEQMKSRGMKMAVVETGGDEGHAPARRTYEKAGYTPLPLVRYFQRLS